MRTGLLRRSFGASESEKSLRKAFVIFPVSSLPYAAPQATHVKEKMDRLRENQRLLVPFPSIGYIAVPM